MKLSSHDEEEQILFRMVAKQAGKAMVISVMEASAMTGELLEVIKLLQRHTAPEMHLRKAMYSINELVVLQLDISLKQCIFRARWRW